MIREDGYTQMVDGVGVTISSNEVFRFKCCNCGLVHDMVVATEEKQELGFAIKQVVEGEYV